VSRTKSKHVCRVGVTSSSAFFWQKIETPGPSQDRRSFCWAIVIRARGLKNHFFVQAQADLSATSLANEVLC
jgi:hypothetical protein